MRNNNWNWLIFLVPFIYPNNCLYSDISVVKNKSPAREIKYFDDSSNLLVLRDEHLLISKNDGKSFEEIPDIKRSNYLFLKWIN